MKLLTAAFEKASKLVGARQDQLAQDAYACPPIEAILDRVHDSGLDGNDALAAKALRFAGEEWRVAQIPGLGSSEDRFQRDHTCIRV